MIEVNFFKNKRFLLTLLVDIILVVVIIYLMNYVQFLVNEDARINLTEIVTQNKNVVASRLMLEVNNIELDAKQLAERFDTADAASYDDMKAIFLNYVKSKNDKSLMWSAKNGSAVAWSGNEFNISGRSYFRLALQGISNISERIISRQTGEDIFVICSPIIYGNKIVGTVQKQYSPQEMYEICSASLFSSQGYTYIINSQGYILIFSRETQYNRESDNYYRIVYITDPVASKQMESDIKNKRAGFLEAKIDGKQMFSAYTPIDQVYDWYLISSIDKDAVSPNSMIIIQIFYWILLVVLLLFTFSMFYYMMQKRKEKENLERIAFVDYVTLGNTFTKFTVDLNRILESNKDDTFHLCAFDIDNFKFINGFYGFEVGDKILRDIYAIYNKRLSSDELIARVHSDHFVMLIKDVSESRLRKLVDEEFHFGDIVVYFSAGLYKINNRKESVNLMLDKASLAAQKVKGVRYSHIEVYSDSFDRELTRNEQIKRSIEQALRDDEIIPFFQPKVNLYTRELIGAEALARWRRKDGKMVSPGEFIPVCEKSGLITLVDMAIYEQTLKFIRKNLDAGIECAPISVNFSRLHLFDKFFMQTVVEKLRKYDVPPELIELELTETIMFENSENINKFIDELHSYGLKISMDDFGSGYSSLHMLKDIDIDVLKIDRSFLLDTANVWRQKIVFGTIVDMAHKLNIKVVVEGVETEENLALAKEFGCYIIQGYYFSRPLDEASFEKIYREGKL